MKLHSIVGAIALALGAASVASAQGNTPPNGPPQGGPPHGGRMGGGRMKSTAHQMMSPLFKGITLTDAQKAQFEKLNATQDSQAKVMFDSLKGKRPDAASKAKMQATRAKWRADYRAVLTPDQQVIYDQNIAEMQAMMQRRMQEQGRDGHGGRGPGGPPPQQ